MAFGIFLHRSDSIYDDRLAERYQFPRQYLSRAKACVGGWIIYLEPTKVHATRGYFAAAKVQDIVPDSTRPDMYSALIEPNTYIEFSDLVPFKGQDGLVELGLLNDAGKISGRAQSAVRPLSAVDFNRIIDRGLNADSTLLPRIGDIPSSTDFREHQAPYDSGATRDRTMLLMSRITRDRAFRQVVLRAYDSRCAMTGLRLINGGGRAEAEAAHIRPVSENGPDCVSNGLALSGTVHWMFDRGLLGIADDLRILISRQVNNAETVAMMINETGHLLHTQRKGDRPQPQYLRWHRENCFKG